MKQGRSYFTVIVWILLAAIAAYFVYNVASSLYAPLMTATVTQYEAGAGYYASGFVVRAEEVVTSEYDTTVLACAEGAHVAANDVVATGYRSDDAKTRKTRMDELTGQIEQLQYAWSAASSVYDQAALDSSIADSLSHLSQYLARRDMNSVSDLTPELIALFKENGVGRKSSLTCTVSPALPFVELDPEKTHSTEIQKVNGNIVYKGIVHAAQAALEAGIPVGLGTDSACPYVTHYDMWREVVYFERIVGAPRKLALHTATLGNARILGLGDETGSIEAGKAADLIVLDENPLENLEALRQVKMVMARGKLVSGLSVKHLPELDRELDEFLPR